MYYANLCQVVAAVAFLIYILDTVMAYRRFQELRAETQRAVAEGRSPHVQREAGFCIIF